MSNALCLCHPVPRATSCASGFTLACQHAVLSRTHQQYAVCMIVAASTLDNHRKTRSPLCRYVPELDRIVLKDSMSQRPFATSATCRKAVITTRILGLVHELCLKGIHVTKRWVACSVSAHLGDNRCQPMYGVWLLTGALQGSVLHGRQAV